MLYPQNLGVFFCMSELSVWFDTSLLTVCPHSLSKPHRLHGVSLCTAVCMETCNQERERRWTWGSIRGSDLGWQQSSLLDFCGDRPWQCLECTGRKQQWRYLLWVFAQSTLCRQTWTERIEWHFKVLIDPNYETKKPQHIFSRKG